MYERKPKNMAFYGLIGETMIEVGDLVRIHPDEAAGVWLVIQIDSWSWVCQAIQGNKNEWFDIGQVEVVTHD
jgi:hypothetical protein